MTERRWNNLKYESIFILAPDLPDTDKDETIKKVEELITKNSGKVLETERWEKKRLAYPVKKHTQGYYVLVRLEAPVKLINPLEKFYRLSEHIIKFLTIKVTDFKRQTDSVPLPENSTDRTTAVSKANSNSDNNHELENTNNSKK